MVTFAASPVASALLVQWRSSAAELGLLPAVVVPVAEEDWMDERVLHMASSLNIPRACVIARLTPPPAGLPKRTPCPDQLVFVP